MILCLLSTPRICKPFKSSQQERLAAACAASRVPLQQHTACSELAPSHKARKCMQVSEARPLIEEAESGKLISDQAVRHCCLL